MTRAEIWRWRVRPNGNKTAKGAKTAKKDRFAIFAVLAVPYVETFYQRVCMPSPMMRPWTMLFGRRYDAVA